MSGGIFSVLISAWPSENSHAPSLVLSLLWVIMRRVLRVLGVHACMAIRTYRAPLPVHLFHSQRIWMHVSYWLHTGCKST